LSYHKEDGIRAKAFLTLLKTSQTDFENIIEINFGTLQIKFFSPSVNCMHCIEINENKGL